MTRKQKFIYVIGLVAFGYYLGIFLKSFFNAFVSVLAKRTRQEEAKAQGFTPYRVRYTPKAKAN